MAAAITLERVQKLVDQLPAQDQLKLVAHISERLSAVMPTVPQDGDEAEAARQQSPRVAKELLAEVGEVVDDAQGEFEAAETIKMLRGARPQPGPNDWLTKVGLIAAADPIMREIDAEGRRIRKSQKPI